MRFDDTLESLFRAAERMVDPPSGERHEYLAVDLKMAIEDCRVAWWERESAFLEAMEEMPGEGDE